MNDGRIRRWALLGALASAALLMPACDRKFPKEGGDYEGVANEAQKNERYQIDDSSGQQQGSQDATGGSGFQQQQGNPEGIGAPGYSTPREDLDIAPQGQQEPWPQKTEEGGADKSGERERTPNTSR